MWQNKQNTCLYILSLHITHLTWIYMIKSDKFIYMIVFFSSKVVHKTREFRGSP